MIRITSLCDKYVYVWMSFLKADNMMLLKKKIWKIYILKMSLECITLRQYSVFKPLMKQMLCSLRCVISYQLQWHSNIFHKCRLKGNHWKSSSEPPPLSPSVHSRRTPPRSRPIVMLRSFFVSITIFNCYVKWEPCNWDNKNKLSS